MENKTPEAEKVHPINPKTKLQLQTNWWEWWYDSILTWLHTFTLA